MGITPAHAGKSPLRLRVCLPARDHPRACGEKVLALLDIAYSRGSPPRMRGTA